MLTWKKNLLQVYCITEKKILVMLPVQSILLIPLRVKLQASVEYRRRWWSPFIVKQLALGFKIQTLVVESFPIKAAGFRIPGKVSGGVHLKQIFRVVKICPSCIWEQTVIEGISYLIKQFGTCTCIPQPCMIERTGCSCCSDLPIERKFMQYQILSLKSKDLG